MVVNLNYAEDFRVPVLVGRAARREHAGSGGQNADVSIGAKCISSQYSGPSAKSSGSKSCEIAPSSEWRSRGGIDFPLMDRSSLPVHSKIAHMHSKPIARWGRVQAQRRVWLKPAENLAAV